MPPKPKLKTEDSVSDNPWRSRFPVARIKKIMQADEDVGKVAQVVPVIISKALEMFMASMIDEACRHTAETGHKRVLPGHLKMAVKANPMFDFLEGNVDSLPDPVHMETKQAEEKKMRRSRAKKAHDEIGPAPHLHKDDSIVEDDVLDEPQAPKRQKLEPIDDSGASGGHSENVANNNNNNNNHSHRSMSIANLITATSPPAFKSETSG